MKKLFVCGLLMAVVLTACQNKGIEVLTQSRSKAFTAIVEESFTDDTKTSMDGAGNVLWKKGDQVSLFAGSTVNEQYQVSDDSDGKTSASLNKVTGGGFVAGTDIDNNVAFYPYASAAGITKSESNYIISDITLPATQSYAAGSFGNGTFPMVAVTGSTEDMTLKFKNVLGGLKLQLKGTATITSISVSGNNNEILCGASEVTTTYGGVPSISLSDASAKTVTMNCGAGVALNTETATSFIIELTPMTMEGGFTVVVTDSEGKQMEIKTTRSQTIPRSNLLRMPAVTYEGTSPEVVVPEMVDLGLSVKWASCNVGASSPEEYGDYFAWGETEAKSIYDWSTYKWCAGSNSSITKYCNNANYGHEGFTDNKIVLDAEDDVARVKLGGKWRIPIDAEFIELWNTEGNPNYKWEWKTINNHNGWHITYLVNGNSIFLPAAGRRNGNYSYYTGNHGDYMASQLSTTNSDVAWGMNFDSGVITYGHYSRSSGRSVRPVYDESIIPLDTNVEFEDTKFKAYCLANFDKDGDGEVSHKEALDVEVIDIYCGNMNSLKGIEWFINLKRLRCGWNNLTSLDVSHNTALIYLGCEQNKLTSLDVSHNTALQKLECYSNQLTNLDVSKNLLLTHFTCGWNQLTSIDVSHNTALTIFGCDANPLKVLDVSHNTALTTLACYRNELKNLDISHNSELQELVCFANELTNLDISHNTKLIKIECNGNCLASIDVSKNIALTQLDCRTNQLTSLDISNNAALTDLWCSSNPSLSVLWMKRNQNISTLDYDSSITTIKYVDDFSQSAAVDLGLSVKWGSCNIGATTPEEYGNYYAWGETETKSKYYWSTYKYCNGSETTMTKYCTNSSYGYNGFTDNKTVLDLSDDAARVKLGGSWRMPTDAEWTELRNNCTWTWTTQNGVNGYKVTSKTNGNSIFLPAAGYRYGPSLYNVGSYCNFWSSTLYTDSPSGAWQVYFYSSGISRNGSTRYIGKSIRPVLE